MKTLLRKCPICKLYTLNLKCPKCQTETIFPHPAKFSPDDRYVMYRVKDRYV